jgi:hypothetical protein
MGSGSETFRAVVLEKILKSSDALFRIQACWMSFVTGGSTARRPEKKAMLK